MYGEFDYEHFRLNNFIFTGNIATLANMSFLTRNIRILAFVSLFTDMASEMLYPVMPLYLRYVGYSVIFIGILEGFAEAIAGLSKSYFGRMSDLSGKRLPFVRLGYTLSAVSKPMLAVFSYAWWIFLSRTTDRFGKGIRTGARDAMLSDESSASDRGRVFGYHRAMDTLGAVVGPLMALLFLYYRPEDFRTLFLLAFLPGILAVLLSYRLKESTTVKSIKSKPGFLAFVGYWKRSPGVYKRLMFGLLLFALFNSSDVFLLLIMHEQGLDDHTVIGIYIFYNLVYALAAYPMGYLADKIGIKRVFLAGLLLFAIVYAGFAINTSLYVFLLLFALYGIYAASTEGIAKAWISKIVEKEDTATAIGTYSGFQSICALLASSLCGFIWYHAGPAFALLLTSAMSLAVLFYLAFSRTIRN